MKIYVVTISVDPFCSSDFAPWLFNRVPSRKEMWEIIVDTCYFAKVNNVEYADINDWTWDFDYSIQTVINLDNIQK